MWRLLLLSGLLLLAPARGALIARSVLAPLPVEEGRLLIDANVLSVPARDDAGWRFDARVSFPRHPEWRARRLRVQLPAGTPVPHAGETWQYAARLLPPEGARARRALLRSRLAGIARVADGPMTRRQAAAAGGLAGLRGHLARRIADRVADPSAAGLLAALAVGVTGEVTDRQWRAFNATGVTHLVAISGMHVTFFAMLSMAASRGLWRRLAGFSGMPRRESFAAAAGCAMALLYALLSGFSVPAQRTVAMLAAFLVARGCARRTRPSWSIAVALGAVLLHDPLAVLDAGFWLSFSAVAAIVLISGARMGASSWLAGAARLQWQVSIALLPVTVAIFGTFSAIGLVANAFAIPVFTLLLVPPVLVATAGYLLPLAAAGWCSDRLIDLSASVAAALWPVLLACAELPGALWSAGPPWCWYALALPLLLAVLLPLPRTARTVCLALLCSVFLLRDPRPRTGELRIDELAGGSSRTVLMRTRSHVLLWGTAEIFGSEGARFGRLVAPRLRAAGRPEIDLWLPGNLTRDVQAALSAGIAEFGVAAVMLPPALAAPPEMRSCGEASWSWDGIDFHLEPSADARKCLLTVTGGAQVWRLGL